MEQRLDRKNILWAALVMMIASALIVTGPAQAAEGDVPADPGPGEVTNPEPAPEPTPEPAPEPGGDDGGNPGQGGGNDDDRGGDRDEENRGGDPFGGPPRFEPGPQPGPGPMPAPRPEPDRDFERPAPRPDRPDRPDRSERPDRNPVRDIPIVRNDPPSTRIDNFQNIPTVNAPLVSAQPSPVTTREPQTRTGTESYETGSSIIFKSAETVAEDENTFGMSTTRQQPSSSMQQMFVGTIVAVDKSKNTVVLKDRYRHTKMFFVDPSTVQTLKKGNVVQATFLPGTSKAERLQQIIG